MWAARPVDLLPQTIFETNDQGDITYVNQAGCDILGYSREELNAMKIFDLILPEEKNVAIERFQKKIDGQATEASRYTMVRKDGTTFPAVVYTSPVEMADGSKGLIGIMADASAQKKTERRLLASEDRFQTLFEMVQDLVFIKDTDMRYTDVNPVMTIILGIPREKMIGLTDRDVFGETVAGQLQEQDRRVLKGETVEAENEISINGRTTVFETIKAPMRNQEGQIVGICGIARDVTERRKTETVLVETEERYRTVIENMNDAVSIISGNSHIYVNQRFLDMFGYRDLEEVLNGRPYSYVHPTDRASVMIRNWKRKQNAAEPEQYEFKGVTTDGRTIDVEVSEIAMTFQGRNVTLTFLRDITEKKLSARTIEAERRRLMDIIEFLPDATFVIDNDKRVIAWNRAMELVTGVPKEDILGKTTYAEAFYGHARPMLVDVVQDESLDIREKYQTLNWVGSGVFAENSVKRENDQEPKNLWGAASLLFDHNGEKVGAIESIRDITERKRLENQFIHSQKMEAVGKLAAGVAHDFNNLLSVIMGYSGLLKMKIGLDPAALAPYADHIIGAAEKASVLTSSLLAFSRKQTMNLKPVDMNFLIKDSQRLLSHLLTEDIEFAVRVPPDDVVVLADHVQIEQVLMNLVTNARDAMFDKGRITLSLNTMVMDQAFIQKNGFGKTGEYAVVFCTDTGIGMDAETIEHIFEPFYTTKAVGKGTGLGLSTVIGIVEQHGGYINVMSRLGVGTVFSIYIPVIQHTEGAIEEKKFVELPRGAETILLAEDDEALRALIRDLLHNHGYTVFEAADGEEAMVLFERNRQNIDLLFLDVVMPEKNGKDVYDEARAVRPDIKVLFYSGYNDEIITDRGSEAIPVFCLKKPVSLENVLTAVRNVLDGKDISALTG